MEGLTTQEPNLRVALTTACRVGDDINIKCQWNNIWRHCVLPLRCLTADVSLSIFSPQPKFSLSWNDVCFSIATFFFFFYSFADKTVAKLLELLAIKVLVVRI